MGLANCLGFGSCLLSLAGGPCSLSGLPMAWQGVGSAGQACSSAGSVQNCSVAGGRFAGSSLLLQGGGLVSCHLHGIAAGGGVKQPEDFCFPSGPTHEQVSVVGVGSQEEHEPHGSALQGSGSSMFSITLSVHH